MKIKVISIGEILWDCLPDQRKLGGAPANYLYWAHCLGAEAAIISRVGEDDFGQDLLEAWQRKELSSELIQIDPKKITGNVDITFSSHGIPDYLIHDDAAWDYLAATPESLNAVSQADVVYFGSLAQRNSVSRKTIYQLLSETPEQAIRVYDINLRQGFFSRASIAQSLKFANVLKVNADELEVLTELFSLVGTDKQKLHQLADVYQLNVAVLTRGQKGSFLYQDQHCFFEPARRIEVVDTVGAGDAFTAALTIGLAQGLSSEAAHTLAADLAADVCSQSGAMPQ